MTARERERDASRDGRDGRVPGVGARCVGDAARARGGRESGVTRESVDDRRARAGGYNELEREPGKALWALVLEQFDDALVKVLLLAALVSFGLAYVENEDTGFAAYAEPAGGHLSDLDLERRGRRVAGVQRGERARGAKGDAERTRQVPARRCLGWVDVGERATVRGDGWSSRGEHRFRRIADCFD